MAFDIIPVLTAIDADIESSLDRLNAFLRFASIGTDPAHEADCQKAADWLIDYFSGLGFSARQFATTGQPVVIAKYAPSSRGKSAAKEIPHVLFYGHYDVQPVDPLELWHSPPFEPRRGKSTSGKDCIFARGAADDKGQLMTFIEASRQWLAVHGELPFRLTVLIEGDEEGDSKHIDLFVAQNKEMFKADVVLICDTGLWNDTEPCIVTSLRGCVSDEITLTGPKLDLHSGYFGGAALNPLRVLSNMLGRMFDESGHITIPGFYKGVKPPPKKQRKQLAQAPFNAQKFLGQVGLKSAAGEKQFSVLEQRSLRPTAEINGIWGGYMGPGGKTVIPSKAHAKLTFRIVAGQKPLAVKKAFRSYIRSQIPAGFKVSFAETTEASMAVSVSEDSTWISATSRALETEWGKPVVKSGEGYSIPVVESFKRHLGIDSVLVGFGRDNDAAHSPNEKYDIESFHKGTRTFARLIGEIARGIHA
jgi:acetylornithine deacetylase/succinyl-diaminopimelate desuccinylase-like protein